MDAAMGELANSCEVTVVLRTQPTPTTDRSPHSPRQIQTFKTGTCLMLDAQMYHGNGTWLTDTALGIF